MNTLVAISAYAGDVGQVVSNFASYRSHGLPILILSPVDKPITELPDNPQGVYYEQAGEAEWAGPKALNRHKEFLRALLRVPYDRYLFHDADSICLSPELPEYLWRGEIWWSNEVWDTNTGFSRLPKIALQPNYAFTRRTLERIVEVLERPAVSYTSPEAEGGLPVPTHAPDHLQLQLCHAAGVEHRSFPDGASWETESPIGLSEMARKVGVDGVIFCHSVKSVHSFRVLQNARRDFLNRQRNPSHE